MRARPQVRGVTWDYDGPACDSLIPGLAAIRKIAPLHNLNHTDESVVSLIKGWGLTGADLLTTCFDLSDEQGRKVYLSWIEEDKDDQPPLIPGAKETMATLQERGVIQTILTSRPSFGLDHSLEHHGLKGFFSHIATTCGTEFRKPDPRAFDCTIEMYAAHGISPDEIVFMGDTFVDWQAGQARGITTFIVRTGPFGHYPPETWGLDIPPEHLIDSSADLPGRLEELGLLS